MAGVVLTSTVLGSHARAFKTVFDQANSELMDVFGMVMVELPKSEKVTARQKRGTALIPTESHAIADTNSCRCIRLEQDERNVGAADHRTRAISSARGHRPFKTRGEGRG